MAALQDYFEYEAGSTASRGLSEETKRRIKQWVEDNR